MTSIRLLFLTVISVVVLIGVEGRRVYLRPISARDVYRILRDAGREEAVPEGRVVSPGFVSGLVLGLKKGVAGVSIADGIASLSNHQTNNATVSQNTSKPSFSYNGTSNEICFTSRSSTSDIVASGEGRQEQPTGTATMPSVTSTAQTGPTGTVTATTNPTTTNEMTNTGTGSGTGSGTQTQTITTTEDTSPTVNCIVIKKE